MRIKREENCVYLSGHLDESVEVLDLENAVNQAAESSPENTVFLNLEKTDHINSEGVSRFLLAKKNASKKIVYRRVPPNMVTQLNAIKQFIKKGDSVESFSAPFFSNSMEKIVEIWLQVGIDIPILDDYEDFEFDSKILNDKDLEPEFEPDDYFSFLTSLS